MKEQNPVIDQRASAQSRAGLREEYFNAVIESRRSTGARDVGAPGAQARNKRRVVTPLGSQMPVALASNATTADVGCSGRRLFVSSVRTDMD